MVKTKEPEQQSNEVTGKITKISASSRASVKVGDSYYTVEYTEERAMPQDTDYNIADERDALWNTVNDEVDNQIADILSTFKKR